VVLFLRLLFSQTDPRWDSALPAAPLATPLTVEPNILPLSHHLQRCERHGPFHCCCAGRDVGCRTEGTGSVRLGRENSGEEKRRGPAGCSSCSHALSRLNVSQERVTEGSCRLLVMALVRSRANVLSQRRTAAASAVSAASGSSRSTREEHIWAVARITAVSYPFLRVAFMHLRPPPPFLLSTQLRPSLLSCTAGSSSTLSLTRSCRSLLPSPRLRHGA
jgi:hypothetical protein